MHTSGVEAMRSIHGAVAPSEVITLRNGARVAIRPVTPADRDAERAFIDSLSDETRHDRFLGQVRHSSEALLDRLTHVDQDRDCAIAVVAFDEPGRPFVGVGRYARSASRDSCEVAITVADAWQRLGLGTYLAERLIETARARGIKRMESIDAGCDTRMDRFARSLGFRALRDPLDVGQVIHELRL